MKHPFPLIAVVVLFAAGCADTPTRSIGPSPLTVTPLASHGLPAGHISIRSEGTDVAEVCDFRAPVLSANENSGKVDVIFDLLPGVRAYELEIDRWNGSAWDMYERSQVQEPFTWYGAQQPDRFKLRLRSLVCGNQGSWSEPAFVSVDRGAPSLPSPVQAPFPTLINGQPIPRGVGGDAQPRLPAESPSTCFFCHHAIE